MPQYLLVKHYRGGPAQHVTIPPMDRWEPQDVAAHMAFLGHVSDVLRASGEHAEASALTPASTWVRFDGPGAPPVVTDGPADGDLVAGWYRVDVASYERAVEIAAFVSGEPGPGGAPMHEWIEIREVMD